MDTLKKGDKVILVREGLFGDKNTVEEMAKWGDTIYGIVAEVERGLRGPIHKIETVNRVTMEKHFGGWFWLEDTSFVAFLYQWGKETDNAPLG